MFQQASLRTGGHQVRIRHGVPDPDFTVEHLLASHMDNNPIIPGITILLRVLPHSNVIFFKFIFIYYNCTYYLKIFRLLV